MSFSTEVAVVCSLSDVSSIHFLILSCLFKKIGCPSNPFRQPSCPPPQTHLEAVGIPQKQTKTENIVRMKGLLRLLG